MQIRASTIAAWPTILRAAETLRFKRVVPWGDGQWFAEFEHEGRKSRDIVIEPDGSVTTKDDADV